MFYTNLTFNPERDLCKTVPDLSVDLKGAIETGVVLDTGVVATHNDINEPGSIAGRVRDAFDAYDAQRAILAKGRADAAAAAAASASAAAPAAGGDSASTSSTVSNG